jgi:phosphoglycerate dehydrogenase-like enzyme
MTGASHQLNAHLLEAPHPAHLEVLRQQLDARLRVSTGEEIPPETHILIAGRPERQHLTAAPGLQSLIIPYAGLSKPTGALLREFPQISVHNLHHNAPMTAEMALALMLAAVKRIVPVDRAFREDNWRPRYEGDPSLVLDGKTALILGYGAIGQVVGRVCRALGMTVLGVRRRVTEDMPDTVYPVEKLRELLPRAQVLICCLPGTPETAGLIGTLEIDLLPRDALVVNVGRGEVIDQAALYHALRSGHLYAAGLDVWYNYPADAEARSSTPPADYPFARLDNVVMSPHRAGGGGTDEVELRRMNALAASLNAAARGGPIPHRIDLQAGY